MATRMTRILAIMCLMSLVTSRPSSSSSRDDDDDSSSSSSSATSGVCEMFQDPKFKEREGELIVKGDEGTFDTNAPLGEGTFRQAYKGKVGKQDVVVKIYKKGELKHLKTAKAWEDDVRESARAQELAKEFATKVWSLNRWFVFAVPKVFVVTEDCNEDFEKGDRILVEPMLKGKFGKWNNNGPFKWKPKKFMTESDKKRGPAPGSGGGAVVQAFSHWTYHNSNGTEMIMDLQGTREAGEAYTFTDPAVITLCEKGKCKGANVGKKAMEAFFPTYNKFWPCHKNKFCKKEWLTLTDETSKATGHGRTETAYGRGGKGDSGSGSGKRSRRSKSGSGSGSGKESRRSRSGSDSGKRSRRSKSGSGSGSGSRKGSHRSRSDL